MKKGTLLAAVVFVALLAGALVSMNKKPERGITRLSFASVDAAAIDKLRLDGGVSPVELTKVGETWQLSNGKAADPNAVKNALEAIAKIDSSDLVTRSADRFAEYEVDEAKGVKLTAWVGAREVAER